MSWLNRRDRAFGELRSLLQGEPSREAFAQILELLTSGWRAPRLEWVVHARAVLDASWPEQARQARGALALELLGQPRLEGLACELRLEREQVQRSPWTRLAQADHLRGLVALCARRCGVDPAAAQEIAGAPPLRRLRRLDLRGNALGVEGARALLAHPMWVALEELDLGVDVYGFTEDPEALQGLGAFERLRELSLDGLGLQNAGATALGELRAPAQLERLDLSVNAIGDRGARQLARGALLSHLRELSMANNPLRAPGAEALLEALPVGERLEELDLSGSFLGESGARALARAEHLRGLRRLRLADSDLGAAGVWALAQAEHLASLEVLDMHGVGMGDEGARALAQASQLSSLRELNLVGNGITAEGARALAQAGHLAGLEKLSILYRNELGQEGLRALAGSEVLPEALRKQWRSALERS